jgi:hypothetical protein
MEENLDFGFLEFHLMLIRVRFGIVSKVKEL